MKIFATIVSNMVLGKDEGFNVNRSSSDFREKITRESGNLIFALRFTPAKSLAVYTHTHTYIYTQNLLGPALKYRRRFAPAGIAFLISRQLRVRAAAPTRDS